MQITDTADTLRMIKAISGASSLALVEARAGQPFSLRLEPGQDVRGEVVASLANGRFLVKIAGELLDMNLPSSIKPGETVQLTFMAEKPRLTFSLEQQKSGAPVSLSDAGRWLTLLARTSPGEQLRPEDVIRTVQAAVKDAVFVTSEEVPAPLLRQLTPGRQVSGDVLAELPNGRFQVRIADQLVEMNLPKSTRPGSQLQMMFVSDKPQPSFVLAPQNSASGPLAETSRWLSFAARTAAATYPPPSAPLIPANVQPGGTAPAGQPTTALVSQQTTAPTNQPTTALANQPTTATMNQPAAAPMNQPAAALSNQPAPANQAATAQTPQPAGAPVEQSVPLSTSVPVLSTTELAVRLREALSRSGVFYESHLSDWAAGKGNVEQLLLEPQGKLSPLKTPAGVLLSDSLTNPPSAGTATGEETKAGFAVSKGQTMRSEPADPQTLPLVRQQLELLQSGIFVWQGEAWPGQPMEWSVDEREPEAGDTPGRRWKTALSLDLPQLGSVQAELNLKDGRVNLSFQAERPDTATLMEQNRESLREGLAANGLILTSMVFINEE